MLFISEHQFTEQQKPLLLEQSDISLHCKGQATSFCVCTDSRSNQPGTSSRTPYITLVPASEVPCSSTLKNGSR